MTIKLINCYFIKLVVIRHRHQGPIIILKKLCVIYNYIILSKVIYLYKNYK
jgi:hypothetical protein